MSGFVIANIPSLRTVAIDDEVTPALRWVTSKSIWYELKPEAGGESDNGDSLITPNTQPSGGNFHWHKGATGIVIASGPTSPIGVFTPDAINIPYKQIASDRVVSWISTGVTNVDWRAEGGTAIQNTFQPNEPPAFPGQIWQEVSINSAGNVTIVRTYKGVDIGGGADPSSWAQE